MDRLAFQRSIAASWATAHELALGETFSNGDALEVNAGFRDLILDSESSYEEIFLYGLQASYYNFQLSDHSYFQFSWTSENNVRYAYYPNPFLGPSANELLDYKRRVELFRADMITYEDFLNILGERKGHGRIPVLRYENAPSQYKEIIHPCSHMHIGLHGDDRWPVRRFLSPYAFTLLVLKNYHGTVWRSSEKRDGESEITKLDVEFARIRAASPLIEEKFFTPDEENSFHFL